MDQNDDQIWFCVNDGLEFDPFESGIKMIQEPLHGHCLIEVDGRLHHLRKKSWQVVQKIRELEDHSRSTNPSNIYEESISKESSNE
jgi:hypothetical protein